MNIKTIKQLPSTKDLLNKVSVCCDENGNTYNWELNDLNLTFIKGSGVGSAIQAKEAETFVDNNPDSLTNGQNIPTEASGDYSVVLNGKSNASGKRAFAHGNRTIAQGENSHTEGHCTQTVCVDEITNGYAAHAEGYASIAGGTYSHAEGNKTKTSAPNSHAEGYLSITAPEAESAHAEGYETSAEAPASHTEGNKTKTSRAYSHAEGRQTETIGEASHTEGNETLTEGDYAHAEGWMTRAKGAYSHAEGQYTFTYADAAHSEGNNTHAQAPFSHAEGIGTKTNPNIAGQHVEGYYNAESDGVKVIGCGTGDEDRKNAVEVKQDGRVFVKGLGNFDGTNSNEAADLNYVINNKANSGDVYNKTELDNILTELSEKVENNIPMISVTYAELKSLRDNSQLIPGQQYRITDYVTTTTQSDTQSAGHQFDIIVTADDVNVLNENARAIQHEGDTYFTEAGANLSAWQIWYSLDNDVERFDWADAENGKGVIYRMIDEFGNDCPYDFKNILFKRYKTTSNHEAFEDDKTLIEDYLGIKNPGGADLTMPSLFTIPSESDYTWYYTFNSLSGTEDITLSGNKVRLNTIERGLHFNTKKQSLNNIVLRTNWALKTHTFANDCFNTTITAQNGQESSWDNFFGQYCRGNVIVVNGNYAQNNFNRNFHTNCIVITNNGGLDSNNFGGYAQRNIIKTDFFIYNNINVDFKSNQIYSAFGNNTIGVSVTGNTISANFRYNQINNFFEDNTINGTMFRNIIGDTFKANTINDSPSGGFRQTTIGVGASGNTLTGILNCNIGQLFLDNNISYMSASKIGAGFRNNYFKQDANLSSADRPYVQGCTFGDYVWFNNFYNTTTAAENTPIACLRVQSYLQGQSATNPNHIQIPLSPNKSEITVAKNSDGVIKVYNTTN